MPLPTPPDGQIRLLLQVVWEQMATGEHWPKYRVVDRLLYSKYGLDIERLLRRTPEFLLLGANAQGAAAPHPDQPLQLTIAGVAACQGTGVLVERFLAAVQIAAQLEVQHVDADKDPVILANSVIPGASDGYGHAAEDAWHPARQLGLLLTLEPWTGGISLYAGGWRVVITREVRLFHGVVSLDDYWERRERLRPTLNVGSVQDRLIGDPMSPDRAVSELRQLLVQSESLGIRSEGGAHDAWRAKVEAVLAASLGPDSSTLRRFRDINYYVGVWTGAPGELERDAEYFASQVKRAAGLIDAAIYELELAANEPAGNPTVSPAVATIFIIHGRDDGRKYELVRLLDRTTDREVQILHEQANGGATIIEKLERHVQAAGFAVVLLTGDDEGRLRGGRDEAFMPRGRQNVIFETGVFIGALGRSRVAILLEPGVEQPSDLQGLVYIELDGAGAWRNSLLKELASAGINVDFNRIP